MFDQWWPQFSSYSVRKQLLIVFGLSVSIPLLLVLMGCDIYLALNSYSVKNKSRDALDNQVFSDIKVQNQVASNVYNAFFQLGAKGSIGILSIATADYYSSYSVPSNFPFQSINSYYDDM